ncbi:MAG: tripartite tricarboxylate transporter substrate binding protein [Burkholderiales bacterium]|nr:tripartite tricarboxylate transporter substrate binding protein [Burkholderiales bacterium]
MTHTTRRLFLTLAAAVLAAGALPALAQGAYPNKSLKLVVPWTAAGTVDMVARSLAERLGARLGQTVVVENRPGATGQIGSKAVATAEPDGYTLLLMSATVHTVSPNLHKAFPFDPIDDFAVVSQVVSFPYLMVVSAESPYKSVADLVAAARKDPGSISYASFGQGSAPYLISELFAMTTGTKLLHVPYKGAAPAITDVLGGRVTFFIDSIPSPLGQVRGGKLRALSVTTPQRSSTVPEVPTMAETIPGFEAIAWLGIAAPAKTPKEVVARLHAELKQIAAEPEYGAKLRAVGLDPVASESPEQFRGWLQSQKKYWGDFVQKAKIPMVD